MKRQIIKTRPDRPYRIIRIVIIAIVCVVVASAAYAVWTHTLAPRAHAYQASAAMQDYASASRNPQNPVIPD